MKKLVVILGIVIIIGIAAYYLYPRQQATSLGVSGNNATTTEIPSSTASNQSSVDNWYQQYIGTSTTLSVVPVYQAQTNPSAPSPSTSYSFTYQGKDYSVLVQQICGPVGCTGSIVRLGNQKLYQTGVMLNGVGGVILDQDKLYLILNDDEQNIALVLNSDMSVSTVITATHGKGITPPNSAPSSVQQILDRSNG